jgi:hypothetical protein
MRTITLPHFYSLGLRRLVHTKQAKTKTISAEVAADTKPRAPAFTEERFWEISKVRVFGLVMPNRYQFTLFVALCVTLALPVFFLDKSGQAFYHGCVTLASLAAFAAFCWLVGMLLASTASEDCKDHGKKP